MLNKRYKSIILMAFSSILLYKDGEISTLFEDFIGALKTLKTQLLISRENSCAKAGVNNCGEAAIYYVSRNRKQNQIIEFGERNRPRILYTFFHNGRIDGPHRETMNEIHQYNWKLGHCEGCSSIKQTNIQ